MRNDIREVEKRVESMRKDKDASDDNAKAKNIVAATMERPANGLPEDLRDHSRLMCDIITIAFQYQQDAARVVDHLARSLDPEQFSQGCRPKPQQFTQLSAKESCS
jgi:hypothetical protein